MTKTRDLADLGGGFIQSGTGAVQRTVESKLQDTVSVKDFGAVGDGVADDTAAVRTALNTGRPVTGGGLTYLTTENIDASNLASLSDCTLTRPNLGDFSSGHVLKITNGGFLLDNVTFIYGDKPTRLTSGPNGGINEYFGLTVEGTGGATPNDFSLRDCKFTGDGSGTHLRILLCHNFSVRGCHVFNSKAQDPLGTDDQMQGMTFVGCDSFSVSDCTARNLLTYEYRAFSVTGVNTQNTYTNIETRGFTFSGNSDYSVTGCHSEYVSQGFDITGSGTHTRWTISACTAFNCGSVGFKAANGPSYGMYSNCIAKNVGLYSFVGSTGTDLNDHDIARYLTFSNCKAIDTGYVTSFDWSSKGLPTRAFAILSGDVVSGTDIYPLRVFMEGCQVYQEEANVASAFYSSQTIAPIVAGDTDFAMPPRGTVTTDCGIYPIKPGSIAENFTGTIGTPFVSLGLNNDVVLTPNVGAWIDISWTSVKSDPFKLHNINDRPDLIYIRDSGLYSISATVATSERPDNLLLRVLRNGNEIDGANSSVAGLDLGVPTSISLNVTTSLEANQSIRLQLLPFIGNTFPTTELTMLMNKTTITVRKV